MKQWFDLEELGALEDRAKDAYKAASKGDCGGLEHLMLLNLAADVQALVEGIKWAYGGMGRAIEAEGYASEKMGIVGSSYHAMEEETLNDAWKRGQRRYRREQKEIRKERGKQ